MNESEFYSIYFQQKCNSLFNKFFFIIDGTEGTDERNKKIDETLN